MKKFIEQTKEDLQKRVENQEFIPMTVFNLTFDENENIHKVFIHQFSPAENFSNGERLEIVKNIILGAEYESNELGLKNISSLYAESCERNGNRCLYIQIKNGNEEIAEFHEFKETGMKVDEKGVFKMEYDITCYVCNLTEQ
jgi:hypothetical protein